MYFNTNKIGLNKTVRLREMTKPEPYCPPGYNNENPQKTFTGTDLYLAMVSILAASFMVKTILTIIVITNNFFIPDYCILSMTGITGMIAGKNCLFKDQTFLYKNRVCNSITSALQTVFIGPFTAIAHISRGLTDGFTITRNLFD